MKRPKLTTQFWKNTNPQTWTTRYERITWLLGLFATANLIHLIMANANPLLMVLNAIPLITSILSQITLMKHKKEQRKKEDQNGK